MVDGELAEGVTAEGISRNLAAAGASVSADVIRRHRRHYEPPIERPAGTRKRDFAIYVFSFKEWSWASAASARSR